MSDGSTPASSRTPPPNRYRHTLFQEALALLSAQENLASFRQPPEERHLLAAVPQLRDVGPGNGKRKKKGALRGLRGIDGGFEAASRLSDASLSLLASDWLPEPADWFWEPAEVRPLDAVSWEEWCDEPLLLSLSSQPPPTCPGHLWVRTVGGAEVDAEVRGGCVCHRWGGVSHRLTSSSARRKIIGTGGRGHLDGCIGSGHGPIVVVVETDALLFGRREHGAGHHLCRFLDFLQERVAAS